MSRNQVAWGVGIVALGLFLLAVFLRPPVPAPGPAGSGAPPPEGVVADPRGADPSRGAVAEPEAGPRARQGTAGGDRPPDQDLRKRRDAEIARLQGRVQDEKLDPMLRIQELKRLQGQARVDPGVLTPEVVASMLRLIESSGNPTLRAHAAVGLRGSASPDFKRAMVGLLKSDEVPGVRQSAANALAPLNGDPEVREAFSTALEAEPDVHVRDEIRKSQLYVAPVELLRRAGAVPAEKKE